LTIWLNEAGVAPAIAQSWQTSAVRQILCSGRIAGLREHRGQVIGPAVWPAIITPAQRGAGAHGGAHRHRPAARRAGSSLVNQLIVRGQH
jgi:hypothetical protein